MTPVSSSLLLSLTDKFVLGYEHYTHCDEQQADECSDGTSNSRVLSISPEKFRVQRPARPTEISPYPRGERSRTLGELV